MGLVAPRADPPQPPLVPGSNQWAVGGARGSGGRAFVANDMHLPLGLPNTWYRVKAVDQSGNRSTSSSAQWIEGEGQVTGGNDPVNDLPVVR